MSFLNNLLQSDCNSKVWRSYIKDGNDDAKQKHVQMITTSEYV